MVAEPDGRLRANRERMHEWEEFTMTSSVVVVEEKIKPKSIITEEKQPENMVKKIEEKQPENVVKIEEKELKNVVKIEEKQPENMVKKIEEKQPENVIKKIQEQLSNKFGYNFILTVGIVVVSIGYYLKTNKSASKTISFLYLSDDERAKTILIDLGHDKQFEQKMIKTGEYQDDSLFTNKMEDFIKE